MPSRCHSGVSCLQKAEPTPGTWGRLLHPVVGHGEVGTRPGSQVRNLRSDAADSDIRTTVGYCHPDSGMALGLPFQIGVFGLVPGEHAGLEIVEDEIATARPYGKHRMAVSIRLAHHGHKQIAGRN